MKTFGSYDKVYQITSQVIQHKHLKHVPYFENG